MSTMAERQCGDCTLCCKVMAIEQLDKPANVWCPHCNPKRGCAIYANRPDECRSFRCLWLANDRLGYSWNPARAKFVLTTSVDGIEVRCDPGAPDAWRRAPYQDEIRQWARAGEDHDVTVVIVIGQRMILVTHERDFDLGMVAADERIVRELDGTRVVNATVVKSSALNDE